MGDLPNRRTFLGLAGTSATAAIAGCSDPTSQAQTDDDDSASDTEATLTGQVQPDQEELTAFQEELQAELEEEEITQQEAQEELQTKQIELTEEAVSAFEESVSDSDDISIDESEPELGLLRLSASAEAFVTTLEDGTLAALLPNEYYDQSLEQQQPEGENSSAGG